MPSTRLDKRVMDIEERINAFTSLGRFLSQFSRKEISTNDTIPHNELFFDGFVHQIKVAGENNGWFTKENILFAIEGWTKLLNQESLKLWLTKYDFAKATTQKNVAIIMAGNIPLVGFHDFLSVLISGHNVIVKQSSNDKHLLPFLSKYLEYVAPDFKGRINFTQERLEDFDAVIATGSDNTSRYFEYYFGKKPNIIRKNRNSIAVITGSETQEQLEDLSSDIFRYFGLGCRNVSKVYVPKDYKFDNLFNAVYKWKDIINHSKYANNYDYNKAVYLMSLFDILENGFLMLKEDGNFGSPISTLFYEKYDSLDGLRKILAEKSEHIQCIVSDNFIENEIKYGHTQKPMLNDYADGIDTIAFLLKI